MSKLAISIFFHPTIVLAAPVQTVFVSWEGEPDGRGTWSILSSCVLTLVLCVYTAVHMNIPAASQPRWQRRKHLAGWVCAGIFAPELVLWTAWQQWSEARRLTQQIKEIGAKLKQDLKDQNVQLLLNSWTIKHSFFVIMGGYQFHPEVLAKWFTDEYQWTGWRRFVLVDKRQPKSVLTSKGLIELLKREKGHKLPVLTVQDIDDRSKADKLAKLLSCVQGLWLLMQIIARLASRLTITELEVNTLAHVLCAVAMYAFWMKKPLNIEQPVWLDDDDLREWALVIRSMPNHIQKFWPHYRKCIQRRSQMAGRELQITTHQFHPSLPSDDCETCRKNGLASEFKDASVLVLSGNVKMSLEGIIHSLNSRLDRNLDFDFVCSDGNFYMASSGEGYSILSIDYRQLKAFLEICGRPECDTWLDEWVDVAWKTSLLLQRCSRMAKGDYMEELFNLAIMIMVSSLYGGLHASLWQHHFPTVTELWMWRLSSVIVAGNGLFLALFVIMGTCYFHYEGRLDQGKQQIVGVHQIWQLCGIANDFLGPIFHTETYLCKCLRWLLVALFAAVQFVFVFCRMFLFVEAFVSLRSQPQDAYNTPSWSQWLPHL